MEDTQELIVKSEPNLAMFETSEEPLPVRPMSDEFTVECP